MVYENSKNKLEKYGYRELYLAVKSDLYFDRSTNFFSELIRSLIKKGYIEYDGSKLSITFRGIEEYDRHTLEIDIQTKINMKNTIFSVLLGLLIGNNHVHKLISKFIEILF